MPITHVAIMTNFNILAWYVYDTLEKASKYDTRASSYLHFRSNEHPDDVLQSHFEIRKIAENNFNYFIARWSENRDTRYIYSESFEAEFKRMLDDKASEDYLGSLLGARSLYPVYFELQEVINGNLAIQPYPDRKFCCVVGEKQFVIDKQRWIDGEVLCYYFLRSNDAGVYPQLKLLSRLDFEEERKHHVGVKLYSLDERGYVNGFIDTNR